MADTDLTAARLRELLDYDPLTGVFKWRVTRTGKALKGSVAGSPNSERYICIRIKGRLYGAHRLAWLWMTGEWPPGIIDHEDTNRTNNRFGNLRCGTTTFNAENCRSSHKDNRTGLLGVSATPYGTYKATIASSGTSKHLGTFKTPELAHHAYLTAKRALHASCTI